MSEIDSGILYTAHEHMNAQGEVIETIFISAKILNYWILFN